MWVSLAKGFHSSSSSCTPHKQPQPDVVGWGGKEKLSPHTAVEGPPILGRHQELLPASPLQRHWWVHKLHITEGHQEERRANGAAGSSWASACGPINWDLPLPRFRTKEKTQSQQHRPSGIWTAELTCLKHGPGAKSHCVEQTVGTSRWQFSLPLLLLTLKSLIFYPLCTYICLWAAFIRDNLYFLKCDFLWAFIRSSKCGEL